MSDLLEKAQNIATQAHQGQLKKTGGLVLEHVARVAASVSGREKKTVAWLHDVVEKAPEWTLARLRKEGFPEAILLAVDALTKKPGESHEDLVRRAAENDLARSVKRADLTDNLVEAERTGHDPEKYRAGLRILDC
ncbi:metal-dependent phosphohydrolase [Rhizobium halophilum]|uniref:metal-dependent phosphohydrolase n=1 Tax=Rhizobium halophilum TaxID=2846852 RepID=UPI001EFDF29F|nr:metal-dependent phosphohydrolase [Rhizobium halophilum]MCF6370282.1 metal-dependent phosphohydrolase [Rhizobium halophilum]